MRADFEAYQQLERVGALPTLVEELTIESGAGFGGGGGGAKPLRSFEQQDSPREQRKARARRREEELALKQLQLAGSVTARASKDASDAFVLGVLPSAKAVSKVAARRIATKIAGSENGGGGGRASSVSSLRRLPKSTLARSRMRNGSVRSPS